MKYVILFIVFFRQPSEVLCVEIQLTVFPLRRWFLTFCRVCTPWVRLKKCAPLAQVLLFFVQFPSEEKNIIILFVCRFHSVRFWA